MGLHIVEVTKLALGIMDAIIGRLGMGPTYLCKNRRQLEINGVLQTVVNPTVLSTNYCYC